MNSIAFIPDEIEAAFSAIAAALHTAREEQNFREAAEVAERWGLQEQGSGEPSAKHVWVRNQGDLVLRFEWRWYDQSRPFSVQPDMNKLEVELRRGPAVLRHAEVSYED